MNKRLPLSFYAQNDDKRDSQSYNLRAKLRGILYLAIKRYSKLVKKANTIVHDHYLFIFHA